ncbi:hypothetical protein MSTE_00983 [Mycobacteroides stephanolepidis]|uniref:Uncharacterized protein n=1 Tax=[Mycobacterium] stephanolepidis TaxID=1520670 RepID=A0A1Z4ETM4_9MYCO|nr:hypothetical protein [[Mycobacterium] stephanolepidis]BAX96318.1 hypothetical protein MSTE_00983 [[Mycobacterium] stephanolepidis]
MTDSPLMAGVKQYLSQLSPTEFADLVAEVREPEPEKQPPDTSGIDRGRARYTGKQKIEVAPGNTETHTAGKWS